MTERRGDNMNRDESIKFAEQYIENLILFFGINVAVSSTCEEDVIEVSVPSTEYNKILIGRNGDTLRAMQTLVSTTLRNKDADLTKVSLDIADYKKKHSDMIARRAEKWIADVRKTGDSKVLQLNAAERRVVHRVASEYSDIRTFSEGEGRDRHIIIAQQSS
ncbi:MAG: protein jag [Candidatus Saccharibacteria bacterium]|jgi:SpoIIIJ-associated protein